MIDSRINNIKQELVQYLGNGFAEFVGNKIAKMIKHSNQIVLNWVVQDFENPPQWYIDHPYHSPSQKVVRKSDNKPFWIYMTIGD
jgi:hypothetical protein